VATVGFGVGTALVSAGLITVIISAGYIIFRGWKIKVPNDFLVEAGRDLNAGVAVIVGGSLFVVGLIVLSGVGLLVK